MRSVQKEDPMADVTVKRVDEMESMRLSRSS
jgi:hypothetical protein